MRFFAKIEKQEPQEDGTIKVYGTASAPVRDAHGEIVTAMAMRNAIDEYMKFPAVREMHDSTKAAGRGLEISQGDDGRTQFIAHVVDPIAVQKVKANVYPGFSIGGKVKKRNSQDSTIIQEIELVEISLVDRPSCPAATLDLWKRDDMKKDADDGADNTSWVDRERWDDGFDFFGEGGDPGSSSGPRSVADGGPYRSTTPQATPGASPFAGSGEWGGGFAGPGGDAGQSGFQTDPNGGKNMVSGVPNATVDTGGTGRAGGGQTSSADYFSAEPGANNLQRLFDMIAEMYHAGHKPPVEGADLMKRTFTAEQRRKAASSGAAMKDGSFPIENKGDLANAIRLAGKAKNPGAAKAHIKRRAAALGATSMLPGDWGKSAETEGGLNNRQVTPANITHVDGDSDPLASKLTKVEDNLKSALANIERLEVRQRRGIATPEHYRLAKAYKALSDDDLAEVLASEAVKKAAEKDSKVNDAEALAKRFQTENASLLQKLAETNEGLEQLSARVQKLAETPMPPRTAGSIHALDKGDDRDGGRKVVTEEDLIKAKAAYEALSEEERVMLLIKGAQTRPIPMNLGTVPSPNRSIGGAAGGELPTR